MRSGNNFPASYETCGIDGRLYSNKQVLLAVIRGTECVSPRFDCFCKLGVHVLDVLVIRTLLFWGLDSGP